MRHVFCPLCGARLGARALGDDGETPYCERCGRPFFDAFSTCVIALVADELDEVAVLSQYGMQHGSLVAGYVKPGESAEEAAAREIGEELGLRVQSLSLEETYWFARGEQLMIGFFARVHRAPFSLSGEVDGAAWVDASCAAERMRPGGPAWRLARRFAERKEKAMENRVIYLAGGCFWGCQKYFDLTEGVTATQVGYANGHIERPTYEQVKHGDSGHAETVRVEYDPERITLGALLERYFAVIDPTAVDHQGADYGHQYRTGVYYTDAADEPVIRRALAALGERIGAKIAVECMPLTAFYPAEEYHQKYLEKNPGGYCHIRFD